MLAGCLLVGFGTRPNPNPNPNICLQVFEARSSRHIDDFEAPNALATHGMRQFFGRNEIWSEFGQDKSYPS